MVKLVYSGLSSNPDTDRKENIPRKRKKKKNFVVSVNAYSVRCFLYNV